MLSRLVFMVTKNAKTPMLDTVSAQKQAEPSSGYILISFVVPPEFQCGRYGGVGEPADSTQPISLTVC